MPSLKQRLGSLARQGAQVRLLRMDPQRVGLKKRPSLVHRKDSSLAAPQAASLDNSELGLRAARLHSRLQMSQYWEVLRALRLLKPPLEAFLAQSEKKPNGFGALKEVEAQRTIQRQPHPAKLILQSHPHLPEPQTRAVLWKLRQ